MYRECLCIGILTERDWSIPMANMNSKKKKSLWYRLKDDLKKRWILYVMILPVIIYFIVYHYVPMYGITLAFKDYSIRKGILGSPWVGFEHFKRFFGSYQFSMLVKNTLSLSLYSLLVGFPIPIIFALFLNYLRNEKLKKFVQMVSYAPHFLSTVVICSMITMFSMPNKGVFNILRGLLGMESVNVLAKADWFNDIYIWSGVWQGMGWSAIIYISALAGVDYEMHEAAIIDGASKVQRMIHIDLPSIIPTIVMLLILRMGSIMSVGFEKAYLLQNDLNYMKSAIISTYVYEVGLIDSDFAFSTAVGLFNTAINIILLVGANTFSKKVMKESLW